MQGSQMNFFVAQKTIYVMLGMGQSQLAKVYVYQVTASALDGELPPQAQKYILKDTICKTSATYTELIATLQEQRNNWTRERPWLLLSQEILNRERHSWNRITK